MFVKTTGGKAAWGSPVELAATGGPLYVAETYSHAGAVFDAEDPTNLFICWRDGALRHKVEKWTTANNGAAWSFSDLVQSNADTSKDNFHPVSPIGHGGDLPVMFCRGSFTNWNAGFSTEQIGWVRD